MKIRFAILALALGLAGVHDPAHAGSRVFASGGPTGTSDFGFQGGWGVSIGLAHQVAPPAAVLVRADMTKLPSTPVDYPVIAIPVGSTDALALGESGSGAATATLTSLMFGLRLQSRGGARPYLDAMVGVGHLSDPNQPPGRIKSNTNVAISFGTGFELPHTPLGSPFADVRYDFHFAEGATTPAIPLRLGLLIP